MKAWRYANGITAKTLAGKLESSIAVDTTAPAPDMTMLTKDQVLVEVISAALNPADYKIPESDWFGRLFGLGHDAQPGVDFSGRVVSRDTRNTAYVEGQLVFGSLTKASKYGTLGQFIIASISELAAIPAAVSVDHAAALGTSAGTSYKSLLAGGIKPGCWVFVNGGSGGVGTYTIQFAKILGAAKVVASTSTANVDLVRGLGADEVIDYKKTDVLGELRRLGQVFDIAVDNVGTPRDLYAQSRSFLKGNGTYVQVAANPTIGDMWSILINMAQSMLVKRQRTFRFVTDKGTSDDYALFGRWAAEGKLRPVIDGTFGFNDVPRAYTKLREGRARGKFIVHVAEPSAAGGEGSVSV